MRGAGRPLVGLCLAALLACSERPAPPPAPAASAPPPPAPAASPAAPAQPPRPAFSAISPDQLHPGYHLARGGERPALLLLATREDPQKFRPPVALFRLARWLGLRVVPPTEARDLSLRDLLDGAADEATRRQIAREAAVQASGLVSAAAIDAPAGTKTRQTRWSNEEQLWARLAESEGPLPPEQQALAEDWASLQALDYLSANILRRTVEQADDGRLWLVRNEGAFLVHPEQYAVDQILGRLKRIRRYPAGFVDRLDQLDDARVDELLRPGPYERWLVHQRARREVAIRARALASWLRARQ